MIELLIDLAAIIISLFCVSKWNLVAFIPFVPDDTIVDAGITLYTTFFVFWGHKFSKSISKGIPSIDCVFYKQGEAANTENTPTYDFVTDVVSMMCSIKISGNSRLLKSSSVFLELPTWIDISTPSKPGIVIEPNKCTVKFSDLMTGSDKVIHAEIDFKISLIADPFDERRTITLSPKIVHTSKSIPFLNKISRFTYNSIELVQDNK